MAVLTEARVLWSVGDRVAVDARQCDEDSIDFAGLVGTVTEVWEPGGEFTVSVKLDAIPEDEYSFNHEELCAAKGFMPGATDAAILAALVGKHVVYWSDMLEREEVRFVRKTNAHNAYYRIDRRDDPLFDQVLFLSEFGFSAIYLSNILEVKK